MESHLSFWIMFTIMVLFTVFDLHYIVNKVMWLHKNIPYLSRSDLIEQLIGFSMHSWFVVMCLGKLCIFSLYLFEIVHPYQYYFISAFWIFITALPLISMIIFENEVGKFIHINAVTIPKPKHTSQ
jgi:hypothetical protein